MESLLTDYESWSPFALRKAKDTLLESNKLGNTEEELRIITFLLDNECILCERETNENFTRVFQENNHLFEEEYSDYMNYIVECYDYQKEKQDRLDERMDNKLFANLDVSYEYIMAKLERFMDNLDDTWYDIFCELFSNRRDIIKLSKDSTKTLYLPESDLWLANVQRNGNILDYANVAKVYAEGIAAKLRRKCEKSWDYEILIQAFAKALQYIFMTRLDDFGIQREVTKFFARDYDESKRRVASVYNKFLIDAVVANPKSAREVANRLNGRLGSNLSKTQIERAYKKSVRRDIQKIMADLIQRELLLTYQSDQEKFVHDMNSLVTSEESPIKTLEKLNIELNSIYTR